MISKYRGANAVEKQFPKY